MIVRGLKRRAAGPLAAAPDAAPGEESARTTRQSMDILAAMMSASGDAGAADAGESAINLG